MHWKTSSAVSPFMRLLVWNHWKLIVLQTEGLIDWLVAKQQQGLHETFCLTHLLPVSNLFIWMLCGGVKAVCVWHGQTGTKWIHRRGESGSQETEGGREQTLQYGPGENCTGKCIKRVGVMLHRPWMRFCGHRYTSRGFLFPLCLLACGHQF